MHFFTLNKKSFLFKFAQTAMSSNLTTNLTSFTYVYLYIISYYILLEPL